MLYDIRTIKSAQSTLEQLTGIPFEVWKEEEEASVLTDEHIVTMLHRFGRELKQITEFVFVHLTSSANGCASIGKYGITDLCCAYENEHTELRQFLDAKGIVLDLGLRTLSWHGRLRSIAYRGSSLLLSEEDGALNRIGYRFFRDQCVCGFLSVGDIPYLTRVDLQPEILIDLGNLVGMDIAGEWAYMHDSYAVSAKVGRECVHLNGDMKSYACKAYRNAFSTQEEVLLCKDGVWIPPEDILSIEPFAGY